MGNKKKARQKQEPAPPKARAWGMRDLAVLAALAGGGLLIGYGLWAATHPRTAPTKAVAAEPADDSAATKSAAGQQAPQVVPAEPAGLQQLVGQWVRSDGGYVIDIKSVDDTGKLDASYLNPNPIHVAVAQAAQADGLTKVFIELRDVNYPGSTYDLTYDPQSNQLRGVYFQAAQQQRFDVTFDRHAP
jgi:hypothetical protein